MIRVYNTLSKSKEPFEPVQPGKVGIYLCGPTVYKPSHIGHMVGPVIFDTIKRYLVYSGYEVTLVVNITDVDDKLIAESNARKMAMADLAAEMTADYMRNIEALGVDAIDHFPRCTENIDEIIDFTQGLIAKGFAYRSDGDVYFDVGKDPDYGKLSHRSPGVDAGRRGRHGRAEAERRRFRPLEGRQAGRALLAQSLGPRPAGLAHRVLGHEPPPAGPHLRHPRRRPGPGLPPSRKRDRPERMLPRPADGQVLAAQRPDAGQRRGGQGRRPPHPARRRRPRRPAGRQDQQVEGLQPLPRAAGRVRARDDPLLPAGHPISPAHRLQPRSGSARSRPGLDTFYRFFKRCERVSGESFLCDSPRGPPQRGRFRPRRRSAAGRRGRAPQPLPRSHGRRFQHRRGHRRPVRAGPPAQ